MMADMLRELHSEKSDKDASDDKEVPKGDAKTKETSADKMKKDKDVESDTASSDTSNVETADKKGTKKSSLRRTLERMLEGN